MKLEICCGDIESLKGAKEGGASRIELCSSLSEGGLTPSLGLIRSAVRLGFPEINVLIRPRGGDFLYSEDEIGLIAEDAATAVAEGATGIVIGMLTPSGDVDAEALRHVMEKAKASSVTFHRAFDLCRNPMQALEDVVGAGCTALLTSGLASSAPAGAQMIKTLVDAAAGRLLVRAGAGINVENCESLIQATGVGAVHTTARESRPSGMLFRHGGVNMGLPGQDEYEVKTTSPHMVRQLLGITSRY